MAIYHFSAQVISRSDGRVSVNAAAYRSGDDLTNEKTGERYDYSRKRYIEHNEVMAPDNAPDWMSDRSKLWNAVEVAERRKDSQLAREVEIALPRELKRDERRDLLRSFVQDQFVSKGMIADIAIHNPKAADGKEQPHAHIMLTMRNLTGNGFGKKNRDWNEKDQLLDWRKGWADHANRALERGGHAERIDHRSLVDQREEALKRGDNDKADELDREPQPKRGVAATAMERRGIQTERGDEVRAVEERNTERRTLREQLRDVGQQIGAALDQLRGYVRGTADNIRERLSRAASALKERDEGARPSAAAERIGQRLQQGQESVQGEGQRAPPGSTEDRIAERLKERLGGSQDAERAAEEIVREITKGFER